MTTDAPARTRPDREHGQILVLFAFGLAVFLGFAALTIDVGSLYLSQRAYQNAADAAALAGASYLTRPLADPCQDSSGSKPVCARAAAWNYLNDQLKLGLSAGQLNLLPNTSTIASGESIVPSAGGDPYLIWVSTPPRDAGSASTASTVRDSKSVMFVRVRRLNELFFGKIFVPDGFGVNAWATAGIFPNRWAVITLRRGQGGTAIDPGPANATDIAINGNTSTLSVINGDIGGNWGMKLTASSRLKVYSTQGDVANIYLRDNVSCGNSCWSPGQIQDQAGNPQAVLQLPRFIPDPNYPPPPINTTTFPTWPAGPITGNSPYLDIPKSVSTPATGPNKNDIDIKNSDPGSISGATCGAGSPVAGPGWYDDITVATGHCLFLSGTRQRTNIFSAATETDVPLTQQPGIVYVTGTINISGGLIVADGVTVVIRPNGSNGGSQFSPNSGGAMDLNRGLGVGGTAQPLGGWTSKGYSPYKTASGKWVYDGSVDGVGVAVYVLKPAQAGISASGGTNVIQVNAGAALAWTGLTYAPNDNVAISGQPTHDGVGQLVSWTFTFSGGTSVTQTFSGPEDGFPYLIEPCIQVSGTCQ